MKADISNYFVKTVKAGAVQVDYWDSKLAGFGLRVNPKGKKTWQVYYRVAGVQRRKKIGTYPVMSAEDARGTALSVLGDAERGTDARAEELKAKAAAQQAQREARQAVYFADLAQLYLEKHASNKAERSRREDERIIGHDLLPAWKGLLVKEITRRDIRTVIDAVAKRGPVMANRTVALISKLLNFAVQEEIIETIPPLKGLRVKESARERVLSEDEIAAFWLALEADGRDAADFFELSLLTAQREGEIHDMTTGELDLERGWWSLPGSRTKSGRPHRVPLVGRALEILKRRAAASGDGYIFPWSHDGRPNVSRELRPIREAAKLEHFTVHDLRRTAASHLARLGIAESTISKILNHAPKGVTAQVYNQYGYDAEKRAALLQWDRELTRITTGDQIADRKVVAIG